MAPTQSNPVTASDLPKFDKPPVTETVLGVQFEQIPQFKNRHLWLFWQHLGGETGDWPDVEEDAPLDLRPESFADPFATIPTIRFAFGRGPSELRLKMKSADKMIQLQNGRLHYNWFPREEGAPYPSYNVLYPEFKGVLLEFERFVSDTLDERLRLDHWEITYVNHIPEGTVWNASNDWPTLLPPLLGMPGNLDPLRFENCSGTWRFEIEPGLGRMYIEVGYRSKDGKPLIVLKFTARGPVDTEKGGLDAGMNLGHTRIVEAFAAVTPESAHKVWERVK